MTTSANDMLIFKIKDSVLSLTPIWTSQVLKMVNIGNEYNTLLNIVINKIIQIVFTDFINDNTIIVALVLFVLSIALYYSGFNVYKYFPVQKKQQIKFSYSQSTINNNLQISMPYLTHQIHLFLIDKYKNKLSLTYNGNDTITINPVQQLELEHDFYLTVVYSASQVDYILESYYKDIKKWTDGVLIDDYKNKITFTGSVIEGSVSCPNTMMILNYLLVHKYKFSQYKIIENKPINDEKPISFYLTPNICNKQLQDDVFITVLTYNNSIVYELNSKTTELKTFLEKSKEEYIDLHNNEYKYVVELSFTPLNFNLKNQNNNKVVVIFINHLIKTYNIKNNLAAFVARPEIQISKDFKLIVAKYLKLDEIVLECEREKKIHEKEERNFIYYTVKSNTLDIQKYIDDLYSKHIGTIQTENTKNNNIFHFVYSGNGKYKKTLLSSNENELFETFDFMQNEHVEFFKRDIDKLKNVEYYKKTGLKRKKTYLFYGTPGCGKTSTVLAMALYDKRHIIEIPFTTIKNNDELDAILNVSSIDSVEITKFNCIYLFDEIDVGMKNMNRKDEDNDDNHKNNNSHGNEIILTTNENEKQSFVVIQKPQEKKEKEKEPTLDLGFVLSKFDGIGNYSGMILIATTNHKDKLDPALYRELRLTPIHFTYLRKTDAIQIIKNFFPANQHLIDNIDLSVDLNGRTYITPSKLLFLCEKHESLSTEAFLNTLHTSL
jgi:hypothetical protein